MIQLFKKMLLCGLILATTQVKADEGMWMLNRIDARTAQIMKDLGLQLSPRQLYNPEGESLKDAVVDFGDFCSGVVVSPNGLVFTNHHCGYGAIQQLSTPENDILTNGFVARNYKQELPAEGLIVRFLVRTDDCTGRVMRAMNGLPNEKLDSVMTAVEAEFTAANPGLDCMVRSYYTDNAFYVSLYKTYRDIRLVFTAPETVGKFGGDTDNWMWPRQTCDFSVFRIYADENGEPADYSKSNKPLKSKNYARVSLAGYQPGDYCMTVGYPGSTDRYLSSYGIHERTEAQNAVMIDVRGKKQAVWKQWMDADRSVGIKYAAKFAQSSNYWKNSIGMNKAIKDLEVIQEKKDLEQDICEWMETDAELKNRFGSMFSELEADYAQRFDIYRAATYFTETFRRGIEIYKPASEASKAKGDSTALSRLKDKLSAFYKDYAPKVDEEVMALLIENYRKMVPEQYMPSIYAEIDSLYNGDCKAYAHNIFANSALVSEDGIDKLIADSTALANDPAIKYAEALSDLLSALRDEINDVSERISYNEHLLTQALLEMDQETAHYSDANFTMRLSYGYIQDYTSQGTHYDYYTNAQSLLDKAAMQHEIADYKLEGNIMDLFCTKDFGRYTDKRTKDMHLCFLSNNDITGGNSGSPMFNGKGELIGLAFDGNWEAMSGDILFDSNLQRCIGVDIRYVLFLIDRWGKADNIIKELGIAN